MTARLRAIRPLFQDDEAMARTPDLTDAAPVVAMPDVQANAHVRAGLADQVARSLPGLSSAAHQLAAAGVHAGLAALIRTEAERIRSAIADAPPLPVPDLARDDPAWTDEITARLSPLLTGADLLVLLATPTHPGPTPAPACVLLAETCPSIQEAMLDAMAAPRPDRGRAPWRPGLGGDAAQALGAMLTAGLPDGVVQAAACGSGQPHPPNPDADRQALAKVRRLDAAGLLDEPALLAAARQGDSRMVAAILAVASGLPLAAIDRAGRLRSAKALVSLAWKSGFTMRAARVAQALLGQLGADAILPPDTEGGFPLSPDEMQWQIDLLRDSAGCQARN